MKECGTGRGALYITPRFLPTDQTATALTEARRLHFSSEVTVRTITEFHRHKVLCKANPMGSSFPNGRYFAHV